GGAGRAMPIADRLRGFSGSVAVDSTVQFWGADVNALCTFYRTGGLDFTMLPRFRHAHRRESLQIQNTKKDLLLGNLTEVNDSFRTTNQCYGGQIGGRLGAHWERFSLDLTAKVALGSAHQTTDVQGDITQLGPNPLVPPGLGTFPGGLFAQSTNIGQRN